MLLLIILLTKENDMNAMNCTVLGRKQIWLILAVYFPGGTEKSKRNMHI
jgi:hypothetical protein